MSIAEEICLQTQVQYTLDCKSLEIEPWRLTSMERFPERVIRRRRHICTFCYAYGRKWPGRDNLEWFFGLSADVRGIRRCFLRAPPSHSQPATSTTTNISYPICGRTWLQSSL